MRLEAEGDDGNAASVALTERFIEVMESEHRELGLGYPTLGKKVRKLVSALARRVDLWRSAVAADDFSGAAAASLGTDEGTAHNVAALRDLWARLQATSVIALTEGRLR